MTYNPETTAETPESPDEAKGLRKQLAEAHGKLNEYKAKELAESFATIGLDPDRGLGKAIAKEYKGETSVEAIHEYAKTEYGWEGAEVAANPQAQAIAGGTQRLESVGETAGSIANPTQNDILAKAEAEGDVATSMAIKGNQIAAMFTPGRR